MKIDSVKSNISMNHKTTGNSQMEDSHFLTLATRLTGLSCPRCDSTLFHRHGKHLGIQRYRCQECGRTFKETVNTPLHWIHNKKKMQDYVVTMFERKSLRSAAGLIGISEVTSFNWRHKILSSLNQFVTPQSDAPAGICEIRLPHSYKGQRNIPERIMPITRTIFVADARGIPCLQLLQKKKILAEVSELLAGNIHPSAEITSSNINLLTRAKKKIVQNEIHHRACSQNIMNQASSKMNDLKDWMSRFKGVATKYLQQYWNWYRAEIYLNSLERFRLECLGQRQLQNYRNLILT